MTVICVLLLTIDINSLRLGQCGLGPRLKILLLSQQFMHNMPATCTIVVYNNLRVSNIDDATARVHAELDFHSPSIVRLPAIQSFAFADRF